MNKIILGLVSVMIAHQSFSSFEEAGWIPGHKGAPTKDFPLDSLPINFISEEGRITTERVGSIKGSPLFDLRHPTNSRLKALIYNHEGEKVNSCPLFFTIGDKNHCLKWGNPYTITTDGKIYANLEGRSEPTYICTLVK